MLDHGRIVPKAPRRKSVRVSQIYLNASYKTNICCCSANTPFTASLNNRYFTFIKNAGVGTVLFVRQHTRLELQIAPNSVLLCLTMHEPRNQDPTPQYTTGDYSFFFTSILIVKQCMHKIVFFLKYLAHGNIFLCTKDACHK